MARELIAAAGGADLSSSHPSMVATPGVVTPGPITTPELIEMVTPESNRSVATSLGAASSAFGEMFAKTGSSGKLVLLVFCSLLLLAGCVAGLLWYVQKGANEKVATRSDSPGSGQRASTAGGQPATPERSATVSPSTSPAAESLPAGNKPWGLIPDQTTGVADAPNALGAADRQTAVISPGGQLALEYREGKFFGDGHGADLRVYGPEQGRVLCLIFVRNDPAVEWERININRGGFPRGEAGYDMGHHGIRQARQAMIRNIGKADLRIDAVSVVYKDEVHAEVARRHRR
jgi:hypothetical protein